MIRNKRTNYETLKSNFRHGSGPSVVDFSFPLEAPAGPPMPRDSIVKLAIQSAKEQGIDPKILLGIIDKESGFDPSAVYLNQKGKRAGTRDIGIAQFNEETAREYGINPWDPLQAVPAAARKLKNIKSWADQKKIADEDALIGAYNVGEGNWESGDPDAIATAKAYAQDVRNRAIRFDDGQTSQAEVNAAAIQAPSEFSVPPLNSSMRQQLAMQARGAVGQPTVQAPEALVNPAAQEQVEDQEQGPSSFQQYAAQFRDIPEMQEQAMGLRQLESMNMAQLADSGSLKDLTPTMALLDYVSKGKGNLLAGYKRPERPDRGSILQYQNEIQKRKADIAKQLISGYQKMKENQGILNASQASAREQHYIDTGSKLLGKYEDDVSSLSALDAQLNNPELTYDLLTPLLGQAAKAISGEKGVLTNKDILRVWPSTLPRDVNKLTAYLGGLGNNKVDLKEVEGLRQLVQVGIKHIKERTRNKWKVHSGAYAGSSMGQLPGVKSMDFMMKDALGEEKEASTEESDDDDLVGSLREEFSAKRKAK